MSDIITDRAQRYAHVVLHDRGSCRISIERRHKIPYKKGRTQIKCAQGLKTDRERCLEKRRVECWKGRVMQRRCLARRSDPVNEERVVPVPFKVVDGACLIQVFTP